MTGRIGSLVKAYAATQAKAQAYRRALRPVIVELRDAGMSLGNIAVTLQERGLPRPRNGKWHKVSVWRLLHSPASEDT